MSVRLRGVLLGAAGLVVVAGIATGVVLAVAPLHPSEPASPDTQTVTTLDGAVSVQVPARWLKTEASYGLVLQGKIDAGSAVLSGNNVDDHIVWGTSSVYAGASTAGATRVGLAGLDAADRRDLFTAQIAQDDWTKEGCAPAALAQPAIPNIVAVTEKWDGCSGHAGDRVFEMQGSTTAGDAYVVAQVLLQPGLPDSTAIRILESIVVTRSLLPTPTATSG